MGTIEVFTAETKNDAEIADRVVAIVKSRYTGRTQMSKPESDESRPSTLTLNILIHLHHVFRSDAKGTSVTLIPPLGYKCVNVLNLRI